MDKLTQLDIALKLIIKLKRLVVLKNAYIKLLEKESASMMIFAITHGWKSEFVEEGEKLRNDMTCIEEEIKLEK